VGKYVHLSDCTSRRFRDLLCISVNTEQSGEYRVSLFLSTEENTMRINGQVKCAKCMKPVDRLTQSQDPFTGNVTFTAYCHGEKETSVLTVHDLANAISIDAMYAFEGKK
jgi:hypothetical protein